ncbi:trehalose monomycolate RND transporter MmpL3 [Saccharopolyspora gloriosae]
MFVSWGAAAHRFRLPVLLLVLLAVVTGGVWGLGVFDRLGHGGYDDPGSQATRAERVGDAALREQAADVLVLYTAPPGRTVDDPEMASKIGARLDALPPGAVTRVRSYWRTPVPELATQDKQVALAVIDLAGDDANAELRSYERIAGLLQVEGVSTQVAGETPMQASLQERATADLARAEAVSMPVVLVLLVLIFGGVVAASLPVLVGGLAVFGSLGLLHLISLFTSVNVFAVNVASLLGLGLAIDYGLFIVGRYREELGQGRRGAEAVRRTVASAGRTVAFSSTLLIIALSGLLFFPQDFLRSLAYGGMSAVALAAAISLTLLPALLGLLEHRVDALALPWYRGAAGDGSEGRGWRGLADRVMARPLLTSVPIVVVLLALGAPFLHVRFGSPDEAMLPADDPVRQAVESVAREFPAMSDDDVRIVLRGDGTAPPPPQDVEGFRSAAGDVAGVGELRPAGAHENVVVFNAALEQDAFSDRSVRSVEDLRALAPPADTLVLVGGPTAANADSLQATADRLPWMALLIVGATAVLMLLAFGSVLLPVKAVVVSALSLSATFGVLTWVFDAGHGASLLGVTPSPLEASVVVLMAAVVFGLSTDYEAFLLSRMVEARAGGATTEEAVRTGLGRTGRMISAAALLLIVVTGAFASSGILMMRFIGVGMVLALALDATVVRMVLVPAVLRLLGDAAWWAPGPLRRLQERAGVEEPRDEAEPPDEPGRPDELDEWPVDESLDDLWPVDDPEPFHEPWPVDDQEGATRLIEPAEGCGEITRPIPLAEHPCERTLPIEPVRPHEITRPIPPVESAAEITRPIAPVESSAEITRRLAPVR